MHPHCPPLSLRRRRWSGSRFSISSSKTQLGKEPFLARGVIHALTPEILAPSTRPQERGGFVTARSAFLNIWMFSFQEAWIFPYSHWKNMNDLTQILVKTASGKPIIMSTAI